MIENLHKMEDGSAGKRPLAFFLVANIEGAKFMPLVLEMTRIFD